jgi:hypothetical protein
MTTGETAVADPVRIDDTPDNRRRAGRLAITAGVTLLALMALSSFLPGGGGQGGGSPSSSYSNRSDGLSAWAELLNRFGRHVDRLRGDLEPSVLDPGATVVVLDAPGLTSEEADALGRFAARGGHLVAGGAGAGRWLEAVLDEPPVLAGRGTRTARPVGAAAPPEVAPPEVDGVRTVRTAGLGSWQDQGGLEAILRGDNGRVIALAGEVGSGRVVALADPSPVHNALLADDDNAAFALGLAGNPGRPVLFAEGAHGYGQGEGLSALPRRWRLALAGLGLAGGAWLLARSRRLGPPEDEARPMPPPRWAYVDAVTGTLARTRRPHEATEPVRRQVRDLIARRAGLPPDAEPDDVYRAALRLGLTEEEAGAALGAIGTGATGPTEEAAVLAAGRALARLNRGER